MSQPKVGIREHPIPGTVLLCDFGDGFLPPEMVKRRPVIVVSPRITARVGLCTVIALSTTPPDPVMPYHCQIDLPKAMPTPYGHTGIWVKGDMVNAVSFKRLDFLRIPSAGSKRKYLYTPINDNDLKKLYKCLLHSLGLANLAKASNQEK